MRHSCGATSTSRPMPGRLPPTHSARRLRWCWAAEACVALRTWVATGAGRWTSASKRGVKFRDSPAQVLAHDVGRRIASSRHTWHRYFGPWRWTAAACVAAAHLDGRISCAIWLPAASRSAHGANRLWHCARSDHQPEHAGRRFQRRPALGCLSAQRILATLILSPATATVSVVGG